MITMPVSTVGVVRQQDVDGLFPQDVGQAHRGLVEIRPDEPGPPWQIR
jgi:hypothetical protein